MAKMTNEAVVTFLAGAALGQHVRVKFQSGSTTSPVEVEAAGAGEQHLGITDAAAASGDPVAVRMRNSPGTQIATAAGAIAVGASIYGAASGKVDDAVSGNAIGVALQAASADGDYVEIYEGGV